jgi:low temperature requirement protein LtrA
MAGGQTFRLEPPRLRLHEELSEERHATWFELYFDLVFAAALTELTSALAKDPSGAVFARFAGLFIALLWVWVGFTFYANRFDTDDLPYRLAKAGGAFAVIAAAVQVPHLMEGNGGGAEFAAAYAVARGCLVALYWRTRRHIEGEGRRLVDIYLAGFSFTTALWIASIFIPGPERYIVWGLALGVDFSLLPSAWASLEGPRVVVSHITERYGTFFIVVLGQSVAFVVAEVAGLTFSADAWIVAVACFLTALSVWWIYFDLADTSVVGRGVLGLVFTFGHVPLFCGIAAFGAGTKLAIVDATNPGLEAGTRWALAGGIASFALSLAILHMGAEWTTPRDRTFIGRLVLAAGLIALAAVGGGISPAAFAVIVMVAVLGQLLLEAFTFPTGAASILQLPEADARSLG